MGFFSVPRPLLKDRVASFRPARYSDFGEHRSEMHFDGASGNEHLLGDLRIGEPFDDDLDNAHFSGSKAGPPGLRSFAFSASPRDVLLGRPHGECSAFTPVLHERIVTDRDSNRIARHGDCGGVRRPGDDPQLRAQCVGGAAEARLPCVRTSPLRSSRTLGRS